MPSRLAPLMFLLLLLAALLACDPPPPPRIQAFYVRPYQGCRGDTVTLNWTTDATSTTLIRNGTPQSVGNYGPLTETVSGTTTYRLEAARGSYSPIFSEGRVEILTGNSDHSIELAVDCSTGTPRWLSRGYYTDQFSPSVRVNSVTNLSRYRVTISHFGTAEANPGQTVPFPRVPLADGWDGTAVIAADEGCPRSDITDPRLQPRLPQSINLVINAGCP
jgi:hypothetical protein